MDLIHEGGLISKLKGNLSSLKRDISPSIDSLIVKWTDKACSISRELYKQIQGTARPVLNSAVDALVGCFGGFTMQGEGWAHWQGMLTREVQSEGLPDLCVTFVG